MINKSFDYFVTSLDFKAYHVTFIIISQYFDKSIDVPNLGCTYCVQMSFSLCFYRVRVQEGELMWVCECEVPVIKGSPFPTDNPLGLILKCFFYNS